MMQAFKHDNRPNSRKVINNFQCHKLSSLMQLFTLSFFSIDVLNTNRFYKLVAILTIDSDRHRRQSVAIANRISPTNELNYGLPQGSVLRPILFVLYIHPIYNLIKQHYLSVHFFTDDIQIDTSILPEHVHSANYSVETCISDVKYWMIENKLQLNDDKTECLLICPNKCTYNLICTSPSFGHNVISFSTTAKNLGFHFTEDMKIDAHVQDICRKVYIDIRRISSIRHLLTIDATKTLLSAFVLPKLDHCNSLYYVSRMYVVEKHQKVQNRAAGLVFQCHKQNHISQHLIFMH